MNSDLVEIAIGDDESVSGIICRPDKLAEKNLSIVAFAHGAANDMHETMIVFLAEGLAHAGHITLRFNFPYREKGKKSPDSQKILEQTWASVFAFCQTLHSGPFEVIAAGKSMGGRVASQMVAAGRLPVDRMALLGYPLHAPGNTDQLRDTHLYAIKIPMLFFAGTRDALCTFGLLKDVLRRLKAPWELEAIEGADHSFRLPKSSTVPQRQILEKMLTRLLSWMEGSH
jgi:predicted alpha/beta-hydrolase family hydrolase